MRSEIRRQNADYDELLSASRRLEQYCLDLRNQYGVNYRVKQVNQFMQSYTFEFFTRSGCPYYLVLTLKSPTSIEIQGFNQKGQNIFLNSVTPIGLSNARLLHDFVVKMKNS